MAASASTVFQGSDTFIADITATADADASLNVNHGLAAAPAEVYLTPLLQVPAGVSLWAVTTIDSTKVTLTKSTGAGSGNAGAQLRLIVKRPHSLGR